MKISKRKTSPSSSTILNPNLRLSLLRGDPFPVKTKYGKRNDFKWASEVYRLWGDAGFPSLVGGVCADQARIAKAILGL